MDRLADRTFQQFGDQGSDWLALAASQGDMGKEWMSLEDLDHGHDPVMAAHPQVIALGNVMG